MELKLLTLSLGAFSYLLIPLIPSFPHFPPSADFPHYLVPEFRNSPYSFNLPHNFHLRLLPQSNLRLNTFRPQPQPQPQP